MCKSNGKRLDNALRLTEIKEYKTTLTRYLECEESELIRIKKDGIPNQQGTYVHPLLAIRIAQWLSPEFALAVTKLTQSYLKADITLAEDILSRKESLDSDSSKTIANQVIEKSSDKDTDWMEARLQTKKSNRLLNSELSQCPRVSKRVYAASQNALVQSLIGFSIKKLKDNRGLSKSVSSREAMDTEELISLSFTEMLASKRIINKKPYGDKACASLCGQTGKMVKHFTQEATNN